MKTFAMIAVVIGSLAFGGCSTNQGGTSDDLETHPRQAREATKPMQNNQPRRVFPDIHPTP